MINEVLVAVRNKLEHVLQASQSHAENWVRLGGTVARSGAETPETANKIVISLVNLQSDASSGSYRAPQLAEDDRYYDSPPPLMLDALIMISANFDDSNYEVGLARLSAVIAFMQRTPVLTGETMPDLPEPFDKLAIDFVSLDLSQVSSLMLATGARSAPFALYRLRRLPFTAGAGAGIALAVKAVAAAGDVSSVN